MKLFLFEYIKQVSDYYHSEGGLVVVAKDEDQAREMIANREYIEPTLEEWFEVKVYELAGDYPPKIYVFPDAGCC